MKPYKISTLDSLQQTAKMSRRQETYYDTDSDTGEVYESVNSNIRESDVNFQKTWGYNILCVYRKFLNQNAILLFWMLSVMNSDNMVSLSIEQIAEESGLPLTTVKRAMRSFRVSGAMVSLTPYSHFFFPALSSGASHEKRMQRLAIFYKERLKATHGSDIFDGDTAECCDDMKDGT